LACAAQQVESPAPAGAAPALSEPGVFGGSPLLWAGFFVVVLGLLFVDLCILHRKSETPRLRDAVATGVVWVGLALAFGAGVAWRMGGQSAQEFLTGYVVELSLSFDNLFVFLVLFRFFKVEPRHQRRVLFWGILGALVLRGLFIVAGAALLSHFEWLAYLFGFFLIFTGVKLFRGESGDYDPEKKGTLRLVRRFVSVSPQPHDGRFFVRENGKRVATSLFLCLLSVELSDVVFAVDSIPAIFGVTLDPFIVYTSNVFAILGLRSFFALLAILLNAFRHLHYGLAFVLTFIGVKMLLPLFDVHVGIGTSLSVVLGAIALSIVASLLRPSPPKDDEPPAA